MGCHVAASNHTLQSTTAREQPCQDREYGNKESCMARLKLRTSSGQRCSAGSTPCGLAFASASGVDVQLVVNNRGWPLHARTKTAEVTGVRRLLWACMAEKQPATACAWPSASQKQDPLNETAARMTLPPYNTHAVHVYRSAVPVTAISWSTRPRRRTPLVCPTEPGRHGASSMDRVNVRGVVLPSASISSNRPLRVSARRLSPLCHTSYDTVMPQCPLHEFDRKPVHQSERALAN